MAGVPTRADGQGRVECVGVDVAKRSEVRGQRSVKSKPGFRIALRSFDEVFEHSESHADL
jgi:hypothetical protein